MTLLVDVGNTNTVLGWAEDQSILERWRLETRAGATPDEIWHQWSAMLGDGLASNTPVRVASVVPDLTESIRSLSERYLSRSPFILEPPWDAAPIEVASVDHEGVGADRVAGATAMYREYGSGIVVDFGTATTVDVVTDPGVYRGGVILTGVRSGAHGLAAAAAKLPLVSPRPPGKISCRSTEEALQSGLFYGTAGAVERVVAELRDRFEMDPQRPIVATGGMADSFRELCEPLTHFDRNLVLKGLMNTANG